MWFMQWIIRRLSDVAMWFYDLAVESWDALYIPDIIGDLFYYLHGLFVDLAWDFVDFDELLEDWADKIEDILSWSNIRSLIRSWLDGIEDLIDWFKDWWNNIWATIGDWWDTTWPTVQGWIGIAVEGLKPLLEAWDAFWKVTWPELVGNLQQLRSLWDDFWTTIFPTLVSLTWLEEWWNTKLTEVSTLIGDTIKVWFPFYDDLVSLWESIKAFFADPLQWVYDKMDEFFERFW